MMIQFNAMKLTTTTGGRGGSGGRRGRTAGLIHTIMATRRRSSTSSATSTSSSIRQTTWMKNSMIHRYRQSSLSGYTYLFNYKRWISNSILTIGTCTNTDNVNVNTKTNTYGNIDIPFPSRNNNTAQIVRFKSNTSSSSSSGNSSLRKKAIQALLKQKQTFQNNNGKKVVTTTATNPAASSIVNENVNETTNKDETIKNQLNYNTHNNVSSSADNGDSVLSFMDKDEVQMLTNSNDHNIQENLNNNDNQNIHPKELALSSSAAAPAPAAKYQPQHFHLHEFAPRIVVVGVGGGGGNAVNNMIANQLNGVDFLALNTDAQHLSTILTDNRIQIGSSLTSGLGCGANPDAGRLAAEESKDQITELLADAHMVFITAGMGGGTGTGAAPVVADICYHLGILTVGVITKPFRFEGTHRMRLAKEGISRMEQVVDTLIVIPNQNLFALANDQTSFMDAFAMADNVLLAGVKSITDLMTTPGLINLDFADVQSVMHGMGNAILGTGQSSSSQLTADADGRMPERAILAAEQALANPLLGENMDIGTAKGVLVNITGGKDMTLFEVDRAAQCITERIQDENANIIFGSAYDESLDGSIRVSVVATGIEERGMGSSI